MSDHLNLDVAKSSTSHKVTGEICQNGVHFSQKQIREQQAALKKDQKFCTQMEKNKSKMGRKQKKLIAHICLHFLYIFVNKLEKHLFIQKSMNVYVSCALIFFPVDGRR